jgi:hypothetical protein
MPASSIKSAFQIRNYQPGDELGQVAIYNAATRELPGFKTATADEVLKRYRSPNFDPRTKLYAVQDGRVVGYGSFSENGRVSVPWCLPEAIEAARPIMEEMLRAMRQRGQKQAWAAYRADWDDVRRLLESFDFQIAREIVNFVAELTKLPRQTVRPPFCIKALERNDVSETYKLDPAAFGVTSEESLAEAWMDGPYMSGDSLFGLHDGTGRIAGAALAVINPQFADPTKIDSAMPCFRLGAIRTESERTKRVNGLFSYVARAGAENDQFGRWLLAEACRRCEAASLVHVAAQCPSDRPAEMAFYHKYFQPQKSFPVFVREL